MSDRADKSGEQKDAEADVEGFRKDLGPFVVAAETTRMPMVFTDARDPAEPIVFANDSFLALTGCAREEVLGQGFNFLLARGGDTEAPRRIEAAFAGGSNADPEIRYRRDDGSVFWASVFVSPVRDGAGTIVQHFASFVDVTRHRREHQRLRSLLDELNHRTQNTLATVLAIAGQTLRGMADEQTIDAFEGRILALSKTHSLLGAGNWDKVGLRDVLDRTLETLGLAARVSIEGDELRLRPKDALTLTMVFHELATNAMAYGALSADGGGKVDVAWRLEAVPKGDQLRLSWHESGGPPVDPPSFKGFGRRLIERGLAQDLNGEVRLAYEPTGVVCEIVMPVSTPIGRMGHD